ncbi:MAG: endoglycosylceramidase [Thermoleophilaceae bacterium]|nr:endoglycosylceramidase [Thermoleophilaceae bacterium]
MRRLALLLAVIASLVLPAAASAGPQLPLGHSGRWITDADGRVTVLHGLNMVYKRPPYAPDAIGFGDDDAAFLASEGYNTVRLGLIYKAVEPAPGQYDDAYLRRIENTVNILGRHGIVSLLDFHQDLYNEKFQGEGWPDWAVQDDGLPTTNQGFPTNYLVSPGLNRAFDHFWANDPGPGGVGLQDRYAAAWRHVADRFRNNRYVLGYDLLNEPWPGTAWQQCAQPAGCPEFDSRLSAFVQRVRTAIRTVDPSSLVWYEPNVLFNNGADTNLANFGDKNAGMSFHDYCLTANEGGSGYSEACQQSDSLVFQNAEKRSAATGDALLLTEFGATDDRGSLLGPLALADQNMMSWQEWHYCGCNDPTTTGAGDKQAIVLDPKKPPTGGNLKTSTLDAVSRPYPRLIAGRPDAWAFDPDTHKFTFGYDPRQRVDGSAPFGFGAQSEVAIPARQYPDGYTADVRGGAIVSSPNARVLRVAACSSANVIFVTVQRGSGPAQSSCTIRPPFNAVTKLGLTVSPKRVRVKRRVTIKAVVRAGPKRKVVRGAVVHLAGRRAVTNRSGRAVFRIRFRHTGRRVVVAKARGYDAGKASLRVFRR